MYLNVAPTRRAFLGGAAAGLGAVVIRLPRLVRRPAGLGGFRSVLGLSGDFNAIPVSENFVMHNFYGTMVPARRIDSELESWVNTWETRQGNDTGYAGRDRQFDPAGCASELRGGISMHCGINPEACAGIDTNALVSRLCSHYSNWFATTFPKGWGDAVNYDNATYAAKFGQPALDTRTASPVGSIPGSAPAPVVIPAAASPAAVTGWLDAPPGAVSTLGSRAAVSPAPASGQAGDFPSSVDLFGTQVPIWALGAAALGAGWLLSRR